jgi:hypothetical protein
MNTINARHTDPVTSHLAGEAIEASGEAAFQRQQALAAVSLYPGLTSKELAHKTGLCRFMLARRLPEIGTIEKGDIVKCSISKRACVTWHLKEPKN